MPAVIQRSVVAPVHLATVLAPNSVDFVGPMPAIAGSNRLPAAEINAAIPLESPSSVKNESSSSSKGIIGSNAHETVAVKKPESLQVVAANSRFGEDGVRYNGVQTFSQALSWFQRQRWNKKRPVKL